jgi:DNA polymerase (family 10)
VQLAIEAGVSIVCSSDAHGAPRLDAVEYAVHTARRGRATPADVLNTRPLEQLLGGA